MSLQKLSPPNFSRSCSAPDIQAALLDIISTSNQASPSVQSNPDTNIKQAGFQDTSRTLSPSLFTPDPNASTPTMETDTLISLAAPDATGLQQAEDSSFSSPLAGLPQSTSPVSSQAFTILDDPFHNTFNSATEALSSKRKLEHTLDSSPARRVRIPISTDTASNLVAADLALSLFPKPKPIEGEEKDDVPTMLVKKTRGRSKNRVVSDNVHSIANRVERKRAVSMQSMNKENLELES
jgi:hypothetical protein